MFCYPSIPFFHFLQSHIAKWIGYRRFIRAVKKEGVPNALHVHRFEAGLLALKIQSNFNIPYIVTEHSSRFLYNQLGRFENKIAGKVFHGANKRISVSSKLKKSLEDNFHAKFDVIPNGVDTDFFKRSELNRTKDENGYFVFFNAGNFTENKNIPLLVKAFHLFQQGHEKSRLVLAGDGPTRSMVKRLVNELKLNSKVEFVGTVKREEIRDLFSKSDVYVLSSLKETFGVVVLESMSMGVPVISTKCGGPESILTNTNYGELCEISEEGIFKSMQNQFLLKDTMNKKAIRENIINTFDQKRIVEKYSVLYDEAIGSEK